MRLRESTSRPSPSSSSSPSSPPSSSSDPSYYAFPPSAPNNGNGLSEIPWLLSSFPAIPWLPSTSSSSSSSSTTLSASSAAASSSSSPAFSVLDTETNRELEEFIALLKYNTNAVIDCNASNLRPLAGSACESDALHRLLMGYGFVAVFCLAVVGNCINLAIYNSAHIRYYLAIRMLSARLLMNTLTMLCLLPSALRVLELWPPHDGIDWYYWTSWRWTSFAGNVFGFCAMWLTVLMIAECWLHIFYPAKSKSICTHANLRKCYVILPTAGAALSLIYLINRQPELTTDACGRPFIRISQPYNGPIMALWERVHPVATLVCALLLPLVLLVVMTLAICYRLRCRPGERVGGMRTHFSAEKRSVTRLTLITTILQMAEVPTVFVFGFVTVWGPSAMESICTLNVLALFIGLANMSCSFYIYFLLSPRFREMVLHRFTQLLSRVCAALCCCCCSSTPPRGGANNQTHPPLLPPPSTSVTKTTMLSRAGRKDFSSVVTISPSDEIKLRHENGDSFL